MRTRHVVKPEDFGSSNLSDLHAFEFRVQPSLRMLGHHHVFDLFKKKTRILEKNKIYI